jgi:Xaa-Pro dipeptidase
VSGKFSEKQKGIYTAVLNGQVAVLSMMKEGVSWTACHLAAEREIIKQLLRIGIVNGGAEKCEDAAFLDECERIRLGAVFFPHGMGHLIGCDTHDVGG